MPQYLEAPLVSVNIGRLDGVRVFPAIPRLFVCLGSLKQHDTIELSLNTNTKKRKKEYLGILCGSSLDRDADALVSAVVRKYQRSDPRNRINELTLRRKKSG